MQSPWTTNVIVTVMLLGSLVIISVTVGVIASNKGNNIELPPLVTTTGASTTTGVTSTTTPATTAPAVIPACSSVTRTASTTNYTIVLPQNRTLGKVVFFARRESPLGIFFLKKAKGWNIVPVDMVQQYLDATLIATEAITSACLDGTARFLTASPNNQVLYTLSVDGISWQPLSAWTFENVYGFAKRGGNLYVLTDTNELLKLLLGPNYAIIVMRTTVPYPAKYLTVHTGTEQGYVLLTNGTIATIDFDTAAVQSICTPAESYVNIGFNSELKLVGTVPYFVDTFVAF